MAVKTTQTQSAMILKFKAGTNSKGKDIIKNYKVSKLKVSAVNDDVLAVGASLGTLLPYSSIEVSRQDETSIVNA